MSPITNFVCSQLILLEAFVLLWSHVFVHACGQLSISGAVSEWYFDKTHNSGLVFASLQRTTLASLFIFNGWADLLKNTKQFQSVPCLVVFLLAYVIASFFLGVFESCIDTIFQCFCEDSERHGGKFTGDKHCFV